MVMAAFSPQYVGQEFVRQYYTMLNKDPLKLHNFYVSHSVFTHGVSTSGKVEKPVTGLEAIRDKICQLNFRNCRAKIRSLDSHPTIGGGVVVQVSGELSNADCPMRKFTQTFVLAPQDPQNSKKYFVFNDIFRYQDEVFEETEDETHEETVESCPEEQTTYQSTIPNHHTANAQSQPAVEQETENLYYHDSSAPEILESADPVLMNAAPAYAEEEEAEPTPEEAEPVLDVVEPAVDDIVYESSAVQNDTVVEEPERPVTPVSNEPVSWASVLKKNSTQSQGTVTKQASPAAVKNVQQTPPPQHHVQQQQHVIKKQEEPQKLPYKDENPTPLRKPQGPLADNCQIFIGGLPSGIHENDVQAAFQEYGRIVEVRLNSKSFGFVAFDNPESAQKVLDLPKGKIVINNQEINIEKKRASSGGNRSYNRRDRGESGPQRKSSGGASRSQFGSGGGRGGRGGHQDGDRPHRGGRGGRDKAQR